MKTRNFTCFALNGQITEVHGERQFLTLAEYLRHCCYLTGTKVVCAEGDCGACTVLKSDFNHEGSLRFISINSCIVPVFTLDGQSIVSVEGIALGEQLHPVQQAMVVEHGSQCGYCTPGFVCAMTAFAETLKDKGGDITEKRVRNALTGNLCRCTGYKDIISAACSIDLNTLPRLKERYGQRPLLDELAERVKLPLEFSNTQGQILIPEHWAQALQWKQKYPGSRVIAGATDLGVVRNKGRDNQRGGLHLRRISVTQKIERRSFTGGELFIGSTVTLDQFERYIQHHFPELKNLLHIFASPQIKNQGTVCGNILNGSPIGDLIPFFVNQDAKLILEKWDGAQQGVVSRQVVLSDFYRGYKKFDWSDDELALGLECSLPSAQDKVKLYKVSLRKDLDISVVTMAAKMSVSVHGDITAASITYGGVGPTVKRVDDLTQFFVGKKYVEKTFVDAGSVIAQSIAPISDLRGSASYRLGLSQQLLLKYFWETQ